MKHWIQAALQWGAFKPWAKQLWKDAPMRSRQVLLVVAALVLLGMCAGKAVAAEATPPTTAVTSWTAPTQSTDGSALAKCATQTSTPTAPCLRQYRAYRGTSPTSLPDTVLINDRNALGYNWTGLAPGTHYFAVTAINSAGVESALSNVGSRVVPQPAPMAPGGFTVQQDTTAYRMRQSVDGFEMVALGTVAPGTACKPDMAVNGYYVVPRDAVTLSSPYDTKPLIVLARCG